MLLGSLLIFPWGYGCIQIDEKERFPAPPPHRGPALLPLALSPSRFLLLLAETGRVGGEKKGKTCPVATTPWPLRGPESPPWEWICGPHLLPLASSGEIRAPEGSNQSIGGLNYR